MTTTASRRLASAVVGIALSVITLTGCALIVMVTIAVGRWLWHITG